MTREKLLAIGEVVGPLAIKPPDRSRQLFRERPGCGIAIGLPASQIRCNPDICGMKGYSRRYLLLARAPGPFVRYSRHIHRHTSLRLGRERRILALIDLRKQEESCGFLRVFRRGYPFCRANRL